MEVLLLKLGYWSKLTEVGNEKSLGDFSLINKKSYYLKHLKKLSPLPDSIIGKHNYMNAVSAIATCSQLKIPIKSQIKAISTFKGVSKRTDLVCEINGVKVFDDFAHHPTAIEASISSIKEKFAKKRLLTIFVPGSNSMILGTHNNKLMSSLKRSDKVIVLTKKREIKNILRNNIKINVIESESQIRDYLVSGDIFDIILILSNKNTENIIKHIKNG